MSEHRSFSGKFRPLSHEKIQQRWEKATPEIPEEENIKPPSKTWDELAATSVEELKRAYPKRYAAYLKVLRGEKRLENDVPMKRWLRLLNNLDRHILQEHKGKECTLKPEQMDIFEKIRAHLENGSTKGYVVLPTGVGKTVLFVELAEAMGAKTLVVVPTQTLVQQTREKFARFAPAVSTGAVYQHEKDTSRDATITTYQSLVPAIQKGSITPEDFDLVILDEAHKGLSRRRRMAIATFEESLVVGFTATDKYDEDVKNLDYLLKHEIHRMQIIEAVEKGLLSDVACIIVKIEGIDLSQVHVENGKYDPIQLERAINKKSVNQAFLEIYKKVHLGKKVIGFCAGVQHAIDAATEFNQAGIPAAPIYGAMESVTREKLFKKFAAGEILVLTNDSVLKEGFDDPEVDAVFNLKPNGSIIDETQQSGRAMRLDSKNPQKIARIYDFLPKEDRRVNTVTFPDILGGHAVIRQRTGSEDISYDRNKPADIPSLSVDINIPGVEVIYDVKEVLQVSRKNENVTKQDQPSGGNIGPKECLSGITQERIDLQKRVRQQILGMRQTPQEWIGMGWNARRSIEVAGLKLRALATLFNVSGDPHTNNVFYNFCREIFGKETVDDALLRLNKTVDDTLLGLNKEDAQEILRKKLKQSSATVDIWVRMKSEDRKKLEVNGMKLRAIASVFGTGGLPVGVWSDFEKLCRAIFGDEEVDAAILLRDSSKVETTVSQKEAIKTSLATQGITANEWMKLSTYERSKLRIDGKGLTGVARLFGVKGNTIGVNSAFRELGVSLFGEEAIHSSEIGRGAEEREKKQQEQERIKQEIKSLGIKASHWLSLNSRDRHNIKIGDLGILALGTVFDIKSANQDLPFLTLCRLIFGSQEVEYALEKKSEEIQN